MIEVVDKRREFLLNIAPRSCKMGGASLFWIRKRREKRAIIHSMSPDEVNKAYKHHITALINDRQRQVNELQTNIAEFESMIEDIE